MEIDKVYTIPIRHTFKTQKDTKQQQGLCHLCKGQGHIQQYCPKKVIEALTSIMHVKAMTISSMVADQGLKHPPSPTMTKDEVLRYLKRQTPEKQNKLAAMLT